MRIQCSGITHIGRVRENNEDNFFINNVYKEDISLGYFSIDDMESDQCICAVCDGVGGESLGEIASLKAAQVLCNADLKTQNLEQIIDKANHEICLVRKVHDNGRIGSTIAMLTIVNGQASVCNVGDSRVYRYSNNGFEQLTKDHTRVQQLVDAGLLTIEDAKNHSMSHVLTQHLGVLNDEFILNPYIKKNLTINIGDVLLVCSDGITDMLSDNDLFRIVKNNITENANTIAKEIVMSALENGGKDNATIIVVKTI